MESTFDEDNYLERRRFECLCGDRAVYQIYRRTTIYFLTCNCGRSFQFDWATDKFIGDAPKEFTLMEDDDETTDDNIDA